MEVLRTSVAFLLYLASSAAGPLRCEKKVLRLEAEIQGLMSVINDQHRYIQELQSSQAQQLQHIPNMFLGDNNLYKDCSEVFADGNVASGLYVIRPDGSPTALSVYCDMSNGGGWTVFQRRRDGKESFDRTWLEYSHGFGDLFSPEGEFWLGNDPLHRLTSQGTYDLHIDTEDFDGNHRFAEYKNFRVDDEKDQYQLHVGDYVGNAGDALADARSLNFNSPCKGGIKFSTYDHPNYIDSDSGRCMRHSKSGWWFCKCDSGNLKGQGFKGPFEAMSDDGMEWYVWHGWSYAIKSVVMMVRAADLENPPAVIERWPDQFRPNTVEGGP
ncbi:PREDICTED: fibrinogen-like protein 1 [Cyprinodon variegatus]|uniref:Fibrinogen-like protein 1 n=1 Tax=Cyprinodon variegatus TaxID=28743 RepID=A0A3Q2CJE7_CYPVA|nr:PREDICTED: fibrinogen-like protein 1 [Cyprinodon variegatus]